MSDTPVTLVHLVRASNGLEPFEAFIHSYRQHPAGTSHQLVLAMKGFADEKKAEPYLSLVADLNPEPQFVSDEGSDLTVYFDLARSLGRERYCFVNSFSRVLNPNWLAHMAAALDRPDVGLVGASGQWGSSHSLMLYRFWLPSPYREVFPDRQNVWDQFRGIESDRTGVEPPGLVRRVLRLPLALRDVARQLWWFPPYPAVHVRSNVFMLDATTCERLRIPEVQRKHQAYRFESGVKSLTCQVQTLGLHAVIVDRRGQAYGVADWARSATFWQGEQEGLLVADNQTDLYQNGSVERRSVLSRFAWGTSAAVPRP